MSGSRGIIVFYALVVVFLAAVWALGGRAGELGERRLTTLPLTADQQPAPPSVVGQGVDAPAADAPVPANLGSSPP